MNTTVIKWGNSLGVRIPKVFAREIKLNPGDQVDLALVKKSLVIRRATPTPTLENLCRQITDQNRHGEFDWGKETEKEKW